MEPFFHSICNLFRKEKVKYKIHWVAHGLDSDKFSVAAQDLTSETEAQLIIQGYKRAYGLMDEAGYFDIPVYLKLSNFKEFEIPEGGIGQLETAYTLGDYKRRNTIGKVKQMFSRVSSFGNMDKKAIGVIIIVVCIAAAFVFLFGGALHG